MDCGKDSHRDIDHVNGLGNNNRFALESCKPVALSTVVPLNCIGAVFALKQPVAWD